MNHTGNGQLVLSGDAGTDPRRRPAKALDAALAYHALGWSIIPIKPGTKKPPCKWTRYKTLRASERQLRKWFGDGEVSCLGVVFGDVSGGLCCRDYDILAAYTRWAAEHPDLAETLPTVETQRGRHVYFHTAADAVQSLSLTKARCIKFVDGELRGPRHFCVLPPSTHEKGQHVYRWLRPPFDGVPFVHDLVAAGFMAELAKTEERKAGSLVFETCETNNGDTNETTIRPTDEAPSIKINEASSSKPNTAKAEPTEIPEAVQRAIIDTQPNGAGKRNRMVFELARALKAIPYLTDADPNTLEPFVRAWHRRALPHILTKPFEETWIDFLRGWPRVNFPRGKEPMANLLERAIHSPVEELPERARRYDIEAMRWLVALCRELQREARNEPFFLSSRTAGRLFGVDAVTAWRWLWLIEQHGIIVTVEKGTKAGKATRFRYLCPLSPCNRENGENGDNGVILDT